MIASNRRSAVAPFRGWSCSIRRLSAYAAGSARRTQLRG